MTTCGGVGGTAFVISALDGGEWSASRHGRSAPLERALYSLHSRLRAPQAGLDAIEKIRISASARNRTQIFRSSSL
jgi:hypothetical protein